jgi:hypothetical protein
VDTSQGFDFARQQVHAILQTVPTLPIRRIRRVAGDREIN